MFKNYRTHEVVYCMASLTFGLSHMQYKLSFSKNGQM